MKKIAVVLGTRPNLIKYAAIQKELLKAFHVVCIDTDQHYDDSMARNFYQEFNLPKPDYQLHVGSGLHGEQTGHMLIEAEKILTREHPSLVIVFGDTNSTLAGALVASKLAIPVAHVEAGLRSYDQTMPEEINRVIVDHASRLLFCPTQSSVENLQKEGIPRGVILVDDPHYELLHREKFTINRDVLHNSVASHKQYALLTLHRPANVDHAIYLKRIFSALNTLDLPIVLPLHPRTKEMMRRCRVKTPKNMIVLPPQGYRAMLALMKFSRCVFTDSGGVQRESAFLGIPCIVLREKTEWNELVSAGNIALSAIEHHKILTAYKDMTGRSIRPWLSKSNVSERIVIELKKFLT